jgi:uncharacterized delta-60 repeat protein
MMPSTLHAAFVLASTSLALLPISAAAETTKTAMQLASVSGQSSGSLDTAYKAHLGPGHIQPATGLQFIPQPDGKIIAVGNFNRAGGAVREDIARFNIDGTIDPSFDAGSAIVSRLAPDSPDAVLLQPDGKILVEFNNNGHHLMRLNTDGSVDPSFNLLLGFFSSRIPLLQSDGKLLAIAQSKAGSDTVERINANGTLDTGFHSPQFASQFGVLISLVIPLSDDRVIVAGSDGSFPGFNSVNGVARNGIARLNANGTLDGIFNPGSQLTSSGFGGPQPGVIFSAVVQGDGRLLVGGKFDQVGSVAQNAIARFNTNGSRDKAFAPPRIDSDFSSIPQGTVSQILLQSDGKVIIVGAFNRVNDITRKGIARLNADGSLDKSFNPNNGCSGDPFSTSATSITFLLQPDGRLVATGSFNCAGGLSRTGLARMNANGTIDAAFHPALARSDGSPPTVSQLLLLPHGKMLISGLFDTVNGTRRRGLARLNADGTLDSSLADLASTLLVVTSSSASVMVPQPDGKLLIGGEFTSVDGTVRNHIARLNANGTLDSTFDPGSGTGGNSDDIADAVVAMTLQPDGGILIGGGFKQVNHVARAGIARLKSNGSLDPAFNPGKPDSTGSNFVNAIAVGPGGKIVASGRFVGQNPNDSLARLNANGSFDTTFHPARFAQIADPNPPLSNSANAIAVQADGKVVTVFGSNSFTDTPGIARFNVNGSLDSGFGPPTAKPPPAPRPTATPASKPTRGIIRTIGEAEQVAIQPDGKIVICGDFLRDTQADSPSDRLITNNHIHRMKADGSPDPGFNTGEGPDGEVLSFALASGGQIIISGRFTKVDGVARSHVAALNSNGSLASFDPGAGPDRDVETVAAQSDGKTVISGTFDLVGDVAVSGIARLLGRSQAQLLNISTRMEVQNGDNVLIGGFIITGTDAKKVMIRALGPTLPVSRALADPMLELHDSKGIVATNDNWKVNDKTGQSQESIIRATTIPPSSDLESAIIATLPANNSSYTAIVRGKSGVTGVGQVEVYDLGQAANSQLANISTRGFVDTGDNVMIGGMIAGPNSAGSTKVLLRAIGPSLGISGALSDPTLELHNASGTTVAANDNWKVNDKTGVSQQAEIEATQVAPKSDLESALVETIMPGNYTAIVRGKNNTTGVGLVEVYNLQ